MIPRFHLAFPVHNLKMAKQFYIQVLGCSLGRESDKWIDFNLYGHQIVAHLAPKDCNQQQKNIVDGDEIPSRHFGVILDWMEWEILCKKIMDKDVKFYVKPKIRFKNKKGEQGTFFVLDPSSNVLEFKAFKHDKMVFEK